MTRIERHFNKLEQATEHFAPASIPIDTRRLQICQIIKWHAGIMSSLKLIAHKQENP